MNRPAALRRELTDRGPSHLARLLALRPDLATPTPANLDDLVARSLSSASTAAALGSMDASQLQVVAGLVAGVDDALLEDAAAGGVSGVLDVLDQLALVWDAELSPAVVRLFGPQPAGLAPESATPLPRRKSRAATADLTSGPPVLDRMGPPYGGTEQANRRIDPDAPATPSSNY